MRYLALVAGALVAVLAGSLPARADGAQVAYFQPGNIYHSGLHGTHVVALTFDDGPNSNTRAVLAALRTYNVKATFFVVGDMAASHPSLMRQIVADGHLLANHSATHPRLGAGFIRHPERLVKQLREVHDIIAPLMKPGETLFFRAPYGYWRKAHAATLNADPVLRDYVGPVYWDAGGNTYVDDNGFVRTSADWDCWPRGWSAETCAKGYLREITAKDGGVVLMHCIHSRSGALVEAIVPTLQANGFKFVRLDELPAYDRYKGPPPELRPGVIADTVAILHGR